MKILLLAQPAQTLRQIPWDPARPAQTSRQMLRDPARPAQMSRQMPRDLREYPRPPRRNQTNARRLMCPRSASGFIHEGSAAFHGCRLFLYAHFEQPAILIPPRDGVSMVILASSRHGTASQPSFWLRSAAGQRLNRHFGLVPPRDGVSMVILASSRRGTASSRSSAPSSSGSASNRSATSATNSKKRPTGATSRELT